LGRISADRQQSACGNSFPAPLDVSKIARVNERCSAQTGFAMQQNMNHVEL
jgi:hypothetical protein